MREYEHADYKNDYKELKKILKRMMERDVLLLDKDSILFGYLELVKKVHKSIKKKK